MSTVYHVTTVFQPAIEASNEQFEARMTIIGKRLECYLRGKLWDQYNRPDDMDDAIQISLIRLWKVYQKKPWIMDLGDGYWMNVGLYAARQALRELALQKGRRTSSGVKRLEFNASSLVAESSDTDDLEMIERKHARSEGRTLRPEAEQADHRIDTERLVEMALQQLTRLQRNAVKMLFPLIAQGYPLNEAIRCAGIGRGRAEYAWTVFRATCEKLSGQTRQPQKGRGTYATAEELKQICWLASQGLTLRAIAQQIGRCKTFVADNFERATGYWRGSSCQKNPITPQHVAKMKRLRTQGLSMAQIGRSVGCSPASVSTWLRA